MKIIIAGGRDYVLTSEDWAWLNHLSTSFTITEVVSGCARGVDCEGAQWARAGWHAGNLLDGARAVKYGAHQKNETLRHLTIRAEGGL